MRFLLAMPVGHEPDWSAASSYAESISDEALEQLAPACSAILGKRVVLAVAEVRQCLHIGIAHVRAAWEGALLPNDRDNRERRARGDAEVLMEPHPPERRTFLLCSVELLDHVGLVGILGGTALTEPAEGVM